MKADRRAVCLVLAAVACGVILITVRRVPTPFADLELYASIALARLRYGVGVPTISVNSPVAVDHIPFYGPVFFDLVALLLRIGGITLLSFRVASLIGTALFVAGTVALPRQFTAPPPGPTWPRRWCCSRRR